MDEEQCLDRMRIIGKELKEERNISVESFLIDGIAFIIYFNILYFFKNLK